MKNPWMKFYPSNWRSEPKLKMCSLSARGLWVELMCLMHEAEPYGHLKIGEKMPSDLQLSRLIGVPVEDVESGLLELSDAGVFSTTRGGVIYSRKMVRDFKAASKSRDNGKKGGNPSLLKQTENSEGVKGGDNTQKTEDRRQRIDKSSNQKKETYQLEDTRDALHLAWDGTNA